MYFITSQPIEFTEENQEDDKYEDKDAPVEKEDAEKEDDTKLSADYQLSVDPKFIQDALELYNESKDV